MPKGFLLSPRFLEKIKIRYPDAVIIAGLPVGWTGWELDEEAAVIATGGRRILVTTDHGRLTVAPAKFLVRLLATYHEWIRLTEVALSELQDKQASGG